jgi:hypothetical protein
MHLPTRARALLIRARFHFISQIMWVDCDSCRVRVGVISCRRFFFQVRFGWRKALVGDTQSIKYLKDVGCTGCLLRWVSCGATRFFFGLERSSTRSAEVNVVVAWGRLDHVLFPFKYGLSRYARIEDTDRKAYAGMIKSIHPEKLD